MELVMLWKIKKKSKMIITKLEPVTKAKYKVFIDEQFAFILYKGELSRFQIKEGTDLTERVYAEIREILKKRAKLRAMHLLNISARTENGLREKLMQGGYTEDAVDEAIRYVKSFGYINDEAYVRNFVECRCDKKSRREIEMLLAQKGMRGELVEHVLEEVYAEHSDQSAIMDIIEKKRWHPEEMDEKEKQKMYAYLMRKGFRYEDLRQVIQMRSE